MLGAADVAARRGCDVRGVFVTETYSRKERP
jgi:hypothetical protein